MKNNKNAKLALAIFFSAEHTAPCVLFYLRNFLKVYNKKYDEDGLTIDDPFNRYSSDYYLNEAE